MEGIRRQFPMLERSVHGKPFIYLDSAATALKPRVVIDAMSRFYEAHYGTVHRAVYATASEATDLYEQARERVRAFVNASSTDEIIFTRGTTASINLVAHSFCSLLSPGDEILITEMEHHSNIVPWQMARDRYGLILKVCPVLEDGSLDMEAFCRLLTPKTKIVSCAHISNTLGTLVPVEKIVALAHAVHAVVFLDCAQSAAHLLLDVQKSGVDFLAFSGHKVYGPTGIGVLYGGRSLLELMPPFEGGGDMIEKVAFEKTSFAPPPLKFEAGTPSIAEAVGLHAALDFIDSLGFSEIKAHEEMLYERLSSQLLTVPGLRLLGTTSPKGALATFVIDGVHPLDLATLLDMEGIAIRSGHLCAQPLLHRFGFTSACRASLSCYNTPDEVDFFVATLKKVLPKLGIAMP